MDDALIYTSTFFSWAYQMLNNFVLIPNVLTLFDVILYMMITLLVMRFIFGIKQN